MNGRRGQSAILGLILLIGIVAIVSVGILVHAGQSTADAQQEMENERIEAAFVQLSQTMATTASTGDTTEVIDFAAGEHGAVVKKDTGTMTITYGEEDPVSINFGTIEYEGDDGTRIAYEAGGVFRETGEETRVVSAPPIHYYGGTAGSETFSFPIVEAADEGQISSGDVTIQKKKTVNREGLELPNLVDGEYVTIEVKSEYYQGWKQYFEQQAGEEAIQEVDYENEKVTVKLGQSDLGALYEYAAVTTDNIEGGGNVLIDGPVLTGGEIADGVTVTGQADENVDFDLELIDNEINATIDQAADDGWASVPSGTVTAEDNDKYFNGYGQNLDARGQTFDLSEGDIKIAVDGDFIVGDTTVTGTESGNELHIYTTGGLDIGQGNANLCIEECYISESGGGPHEGSSSKEDINANHLEIYGTSDFGMTYSGTPVGEGVIYAPGSHLNMDGNAQWNGAVIADTLEFSGGGGVDNIIYDEQLEGGPDMDAGGSIPDVTYLNIVKHEVNLEN